jgi:hypothetical protein
MTCRYFRCSWHWHASTPSSNWLVTCPYAQIQLTCDVPVRPDQADMWRASSPDPRNIWRAGSLGSTDVWPASTSSSYSRRIEHPVSDAAFDSTHYVHRQTDTHRVCYVIRTPARYFFIQFENWNNDVMVTIICELRIQMKCAARGVGVESNYQLRRNARLWA